MNAEQTNQASAATVAMLRYVDVLASVAEQIQLTPIALALRELSYLAATEALPPSELHSKIMSTAATCVHVTRDRLGQMLSVARARAEQRHVEYQRAEAALHGPKSSAGKAVSPSNRVDGSTPDEVRRTETQRLAELTSREHQQLASLEDCVTEVEWCRQGLFETVEALRLGRRTAAAPFPMRPFHARKDFERWVESLSAVVQAVGKVFPEHGRRLGDVLRRLQSRTATITFGGRFNAGKSSVINAALGRELFPTKDLAETGANCYITAGQRDSADIVCGNECRPVACDAESLRAAISLRGGSAGTERTASIRRVNVRVAGFPGGESARWIDPPGMFDRPEMTERAWEAAHESDLLVWIFRSQQFLGEAEAEAIASHIAARGPGAVVFVENAFLPRDVPDPWKYHLTEIAPVDRKKLEHLADELGLQPGQIPPLVVVSADRVLKHGFGFGSGELRRLLGRLAGPDCPWIRRARLQWAERELLLAAESVRAEWRRVNEVNDARQREWDIYHGKLRSDRDRFDAELRDTLAHFQTAFESDMVTAGEQVAAMIVSDLKRDKTYEDGLNAELVSRAESLIDGLCREVNHIATRRHQQPLTRAACQQLKALLRPPHVEVTVANHSSNGGAIVVGAAAGAAVGSIVPVIGTFFGGLAGAGMAALGAGRSAIEKDRTDTKTNIRAASAQAAQLVRSQCDQAKRQIQAACPQVVTDAPPVAIDRKSEEQLLNLSQQLDTALGAVVEAIRHEATA